MTARIAKFGIGQVVKHRIYPFRGVIFDVDPMFTNTEEWWRSIPAEVRPSKDQPFYHLYAENDDSQYIAYVSEQNLLPDDSGEPVRPSADQRDVRARRRRPLSLPRMAHWRAEPPAASRKRTRRAESDAPWSSARFSARADRRVRSVLRRRAPRSRQARPGARARLRRSALLLLLELLALLLGLLLQLLLQCLALLLENLGIGRLAVERRPRNPSAER